MNPPNLRIAMCCGNCERTRYQVPKFKYYLDCKKYDSEVNKIAVCDEWEDYD